MLSELVYFCVKVQQDNASPHIIVNLLYSKLISFACCCPRQRGQWQLRLAALLTVFVFLYFFLVVFKPGRKTDCIYQVQLTLDTLHLLCQHVWVILKEVNEWKLQCCKKEPTLPPSIWWWNYRRVWQQTSINNNDDVRPICRLHA